MQLPTPDRRYRYLAVLLGVVVVLVYLPSLSGGFLNLDDPWLIEHNALLVGGGHALGRIWFDLTRSTRLELGAEYLPLRDMNLWLEAHLWGLRPEALRASQLVLYLGAVFLVRGALHRTLADRRIAEVAAWVFALHPVHVESVAWLAGRKDVLALLFVGGALFAHAGRSKHRLWLVPLLLVCAALSKSMAVIGVGLLLAQDLLAGRRPDARIYAFSLLGAIGVLAIDLHVGHLVGMVQKPPGGSRLATAMTMGPVWLRYLAVLSWPPLCSIVHDVPIHTSWTAEGVAGYLLLAGWLGAGLWLWRQKKSPLCLVTFLWFFVPLLPVSQVLFPLQNLMADRYLILSVMAPALALGAFAARFHRPATLAALGCITALAAFAAQRASLFAYSEYVFADATEKTRTSTLAPYQLGMALIEWRQRDKAELAFEEVLRRAGDRPTEAARRATNNLIVILAHKHDLGQAEQLLRRGRKLWPDDPEILGNLAEIVARRGRKAEARRLFDELVRRFPDNKRAIRSYTHRYGHPPPRQPAPSGVNTPPQVPAHREEPKP